MAIKRYTAIADNTITNAFEANLTTRGTGSNMGAADALEVFSIYGQVSNSSGQSSELSRILIQFPVTGSNSINSDRTAGSIPASGSVSFFLKMHNAVHPFTVPTDFTLRVNPVSQSWQEGRGLDMANYKDLTYNGTGSNWINASGSASAGIGTWTSEGGDYLSSPQVNAYFYNGTEDLEVDITEFVEDWIAGASGGKYDDAGVGIRLSNSDATADRSFYTKKFFARSTEFFFKRPVIEARWDSRTKDQRGQFYYSSSLADATKNLNTIYLYNYIDGELTNIPDIGTGEILVSLYSGSTSPTGSKLVLYDSNLNITGGYVSTGIYSASMGLTAAATPLTKLFDVWHDSSVEYFTSSIAPLTRQGFNNAPTFTYVTAPTNLKNQYSRQETGRFRFFIRDQNWDPNIYTVATSQIPNKSLVSASFKIMRLADDLEVIPYGTGSNKYSYLSYDVSGNYFDLDMGILQADYAYGIKLAYYNNSIKSWIEQPEMFKFRVEE